MTYDLRRLKSHGLIEKIPHSNRYQVTDQGLADSMFLSAVHDRLLPTGLAALHTPYPAPIRTATRNYRQAVGPLTDPPRLTQRHQNLSADDAQIALKIPQHHPVEGQTLPFQPPKMVDQQIRIRPLGARSVVFSQEPIRLRMLCPFWPDNRPRPPAVPALNLLDPQAPTTTCRAIEPPALISEQGGRP